MGSKKSTFFQPWNDYTKSVGNKGSEFNKGSELEHATTKTGKKDIMFVFQKYPTVDQQSPSKVKKKSKRIR